MSYQVRHEGQYTVVALDGEVDLHRSPEARKQILDQLKKKAHVLVDLSAVKYIDSSGVAVLVEGYQTAKTQQLEFGLVGVSPAAMQVLQLARLDKVFPIHDSVEDRVNARQE